MIFLHILIELFKYIDLYGFSSIEDVLHRREIDRLVVRGNRKTLVNKRISKIRSLKVSRMISIDEEGERRRILANEVEPQEGILDKVEGREIDTRTTTVHNERNDHQQGMIEDI